MQSASPNPGPLAPLALARYRSAFAQELAAGHRRQIVLPQAFLATLLLPILWLAVPHRSRSWRYRSRWPLLAVALAANCEQAARASSNHVAWAAVSGLLSAYGTMLCLQHVILTNPQRDAARIVRVPRGEEAAVRRGESAPRLRTVAAAAAAATGSGGGKPALRTRTAQRVFGGSETEGEFCYVWQRFPSEAPFLDRLGWAADLVLSFRGAGWSSSISVIPRPSVPAGIEDGQPVCVASIPSATSCGFEYIQPPADFLRHRLKLLAGSCLLLDFLGTFMVKDPYFIFGREKCVEYALPWYLVGLSPWRLEAYRQLFSISGAFAAVAAGYSLTDIVHYYLTLYWSPSRNIPWIYASSFGSFGEVFDRGLAGLWGSWWHQTFRQQFLGPATFLLKQGLVRKGSATGNLLALLSTFAMSGLLHGMGSLSAVPRTKVWRQPAFFLLQAVGILLQQQLAPLLRRALPIDSATVRRAGNIMFTVAWLYATAPLFNDDMAEMGLWLLEPLPFSVFRALGFGFPGDTIWRWDSTYLFRWHSGRHWWQSGVVI